MRLLIFDLDGTLIDSKQDLANSVNAALAHLGREQLPDELIQSYVGNGAPVLIRRALGADASDELAAQALEFFLAYYRGHLLDNTYLYDGVRESLDRFREAGLLQAVLTNKPVGPSRKIVDGLGLSDHFLSVYGGNSFEEKKPHPMGVETLLAEAGVTAGETLFVGDSSVDVKTARNAGVKVAGVTYGFKPESLDEHPPDLLFDSMPALADHVLTHESRQQAR
jgi:phosphoglycolate phosphatase